MNTLLSIENLYLNFKTDRGIVKVLDGITFSIKEGEVLGLVGETGCGKSVTAKCIIGLLPKNAQANGRIFYRGKDLSKLSYKSLEKLRGREIAMIFQDPMTSLNPAYTIGNQIGEMFRIHKIKEDRSPEENAIDMLKSVKIPDVEERIKQYPHQQSGGMRQRAMIAMMLSCTPSLLIADEPTSSLDVTIQAQVLKLMKELKEKFSASILLITHDLGVVAEVADRVIVMYAGQIVEISGIYELFDNPVHPYTKGLLSTLPTGHKRGKKLEYIPGRVPDLINPPSGCRFHPRCSYATKICKENKPYLYEVRKGHYAACHIIEEERG